MTSRLSAPAESITGDIEQFLMNLMGALWADARDTSREGPGRPRIVPALCLWAAMLVCVVKGFTHQVSIWRLLTSTDFWYFPRFAVTDQAVYKRLASASTTALEMLFQQVSAVLRERLAPYIRTSLAAFASEVLVLDEATLDQVARLLPRLRGLPPGDDRLLPGKLAGLFDIRRQQWRKLQFIPDPHQHP
jgi:hypothetical protein